MTVDDQALGTLAQAFSELSGIADVGGSSVEFRRTQTIMQGAPYCDFSYRFR